MALRSRDGAAGGSQGLRDVGEASTGRGLGPNMAAKGGRTRGGCATGASRMRVKRTYGGVWKRSREMLVWYGRDEWGSRGLAREGDETVRCGVEDILVWYGREEWERIFFKKKKKNWTN